MPFQAVAESRRQQERSAGASFEIEQVFGSRGVHQITLSGARDQHDITDHPVATRTNTGGEGGHVDPGVGRVGCAEVEVAGTLLGKPRVTGHQLWVEGVRPQAIGTDDDYAFRHT